LPSLHFSKVTYAGKMFDSCVNLTHLDMSDPKAWTFKSLEDRLDFSYCPLDNETKRELKKRNPNIKIFFKRDEE
jgi:hypothetical protein